MFFEMKLFCSTLLSYRFRQFEGFDESRSKLSTRFSKYFEKIFFVFKKL